VLFDAAVSTDNVMHNRILVYFLRLRAALVGDGAVSFSKSPVLTVYRYSSPPTRS
jgi:hypothetical protein